MKAPHHPGVAVLITALRFNMTNAPNPAGDHSGRYRAALDMAAYADESGFTAVSCEEHHLAPTGWLPSPLMLAAAVAGRTSTIRISVNALLVTLYDPVKLAEDIAVLDNISEGRFSFVAGMGYRPEEYDALGKSWRERGRLMDECLEVMLKAWADEPFEHHGRSVNVTPKPRTKPHPVMFVGGMSAAAATRAARFGLPFSPPAALPDLEALYLQKLAENGKDGFVYRPENSNTVTLLSDDPERTWASCGHHFMNEATEYSGWRRAGVNRPNEEAALSVTELRKLNKVEVLTPDQLVAQCEAGRREVVAHPLIGGLPLDDGWRSLQLLGDRVLPELRARGIS
ncbi:LLM class flavin-dependent oxidoreductase [Mycolicibacterium sp. 050232]|uniref:LLM class flavin-dependent oxidoreductase n=1 Tax=Mycolicibacterium sp. 050232 TaxID=3113982 RepID=UPI002E2861DD|nr:LLM class flavin-dependent oxidoreductase [Mycolicibacterium sp. 050232]MED5812609.1 LLM class flavin-dependent oxidoreductase [Mycolicibacterium sp. 050232]